MDNFLSSLERKKLLNLTQPLLVNDYNDPKMKGKSSAANLHLYPRFNFFFQKIKKLITKKYKKDFSIVKGWARYTQGDHINWHSHPEDIDITLIYYIYNPSKLGTWVKFKDKEQLVGGKQNSIVGFDASLPHSVPQSEKKIERYTFICDVNLRDPR